MKKKLLFAVIALAGLASSKEKGPLIDFGSAAATDTTYMAAPPASAQTRNVLLEEFTGISCVNCPTGHQKVTDIEAQYPSPGHLIPIAIHPFDNPLANPLPDISPIDLRTTEGTTLYKGLYGNPSAIPCAGIDRKPYNGILVLGSDDWPVAVGARIGVASPVNIEISRTYDAASHAGSVKVSARYFSSVSTKQALTLALVEDGIDAPQEYTDPNNGMTAKYTSYTHNHILRRIYTFAPGSPMIDSVATKAPGRVYERTFNITTDPSWNPQHCKLIAFVSNNESGDKTVMQAVEVNLQP